jgi:predicted metal-dependent hydrolase
MSMSGAASPQLALPIEQGDAQCWSIRRSARATRLSARVHRDGRVDIVVPARAPPYLVAEFVERHRQWIETKSAEARRAAPLPEAFPPASIALSAFGESLRVHRSAGEGPPRLRRGADGLLRVQGNIADPKLLARALQRWLMAQARLQLGVMLQSVAEEHGFQYNGLSIRRQRTRWGSCSSRRVINLNVCLVFQPPDVVRYVLIHELAHTLHMNHSSSFWATVARCCPNWQQLDRKLLQGWRAVPRWVLG